MKTILMAGAALMLGAAPIAATAQGMNTQTNTMNQRGTGMMDAQQKAMYDSWNPDQKADYDRWPADQQSYYWTLDPVQQQAFMILTPDQRMRIYSMAPEQRTMAWQAIAKQMNGATPMNNSMAGQNTMGQNTMGQNSMGQSSAMAGSSMGTSMNSNSQVRYVSRQILQSGVNAVQPSEYPVCTAQITDSCINPRAVPNR
ncbi:hypothetical protein RM533_03415 [Croceicoccus sp. F390]|uniref:Uncharacterized protein n=1 Tax=Croceicoccus esteveae TaxID=3075597 RepID=A0ABU2ZF56_9SPHN|nr:hypothetical protein [Croceicoccus sp. F390]MDT0575231.1 hypothetical protein [Croceicoccus sp. F390]